MEDKIAIEDTREKTSWVPLSVETKALVFLEFPPDQRSEVEEILARQCADNLPGYENLDSQQLERIRKFVIRLSHGDLDELKKWASEAQSDPNALCLTMGEAFWTQQSLDEEAQKKSRDYISRMVRRVIVISVCAVILGLVTGSSNFFVIAAVIFFGGIYALKGFPPWDEPDFIVLDDDIP